MPEGGDVKDRNPPDLGQTQQVVISAHDVVGFSSNSALEELIVGRIPTLPDGGHRGHEESPAADKIHQRPRPNRIQVEFLATTPLRRT